MWRHEDRLSLVLISGAANPGRVCQIVSESIFYKPSNRPVMDCEAGHRVHVYMTGLDLLNATPFGVWVFVSIGRYTKPKPAKSFLGCAVILPLVKLSPEYFRRSFDCALILLNSN